MSDLDARLRDYADRWRAAQPPVSVFGPPARAPRPGWVVVVAVAAAVAALLAVATTLVRVTRPEPAAPRTVPWQPRPQDRSPGVALPPDCAAGTLTATAELRRSGDVTRGDLRLVNTGSTACTVRLTGMTMRGPDGSATGVVGLTEDKVVPRVVPAGERAMASLRWDGPYCGPSTVVVEATVGTAVLRAVPTGDGRPPACAPDNGRPSVLRYGPVTVSGYDEPEPVLTGRVTDVPASVEPNTTLRYLFVLENPTDRPVTLSPCPALEQRVEIPDLGEDAPVAASLGRLNCEDAPGRIEAGGTLAFEMRLFLADVPEGEYRLQAWTSLLRDPLSVRTRLTVRGSAPLVPEQCGLDAYLVDAGLTSHPHMSQGGVSFYNVSDRVCTAVPPPTIRILGPGGEVLAEPRAVNAPAPVPPAKVMGGRIGWPGHCGRWTTGLSYEITFPGAPEPLVVPVPGDTPPCRPGAAAPTVDWRF